MRLQTLKILVTGGAGFVGTHLCQRLTELGHEVTSIDMRAPSTAIKGVEYVRGDIRDQGLLSKLVDDAEIVYHLAATVSVPLCQKDPLESYSNNFTATIQILEAIRKKSEKARQKPAAFVFASTAALYGDKGDDGHALAESDLASKFSSFYAAQKHACERAIELYSNFHAIPSTIFRFFNIYGPGQDPASPYSGVITLFMQYAKEGKPLPLNGGGGQTRDFISVHDIVSGCASILAVPFERWSATPINLGTGKNITIRALAELIKGLNKQQINLIEYPAREGDVLHSLADIGRARRILGFNPSMELRQGLLEL